MGIFTDMAPEIRAREQFDAILRFTGCKALDCALSFHDSLHGGFWVEHNGEQKHFGLTIDRGARVPDPHTLLPVAEIPWSMIDWLNDDHEPRWERLYAEQLAAIRSDPWRTHAAMVSLSDAS